MNPVELEQAQRHTSAGTVLRRITLAGESPPPGPFVRGAERGVSNRGRQAHETLPRNRFPLPLSPRSAYAVRMPALVRAPKGGSNTETDDDCRRRQFSIGELTVRSSLFDSTVADGKWAAVHGGLYVVGKKA